MEKITKRAKRIKLLFIASTAVICALMMFGFSWSGKIFKHSFRKNYYTIYVDGVKVGSSVDYDKIMQCVKDARKKISQENAGLNYIDADITVKTSKKLTGVSSNEDDIIKGVYNLLSNNIDNSKSNAYVVNIDGYVLTMKSLADVEYLFTTVRERYDSSNKFNINLHLSEVSDHTTIACDVLKADIEALNIPTVGSSADGTGVITETMDNVNDVLNVTFGEKVEIVPCYVNETQIDELNNAIDRVTSDSSNSELSVLVSERQTYDMEYGYETQYVYNEKLYNTEQNVIQQGSNGAKRIVADITYKNGAEISRDIVGETVLTEAVPEIIEVGTAVPPTYVKPIYGGTLSSTFGERWGTVHKGIDWACSVGTDVMASCSGKVIQAGWIRGYGYCVTLEHSDGKCTRYAHLSKILVDVGQKVSQREVIALSGNTGNSTGPHVHFEILVDDVQQNPFKYLD